MKNIFTMIGLTVALSACQPKGGDSILISGGSPDSPQTEKSSPYKEMNASLTQNSTTDCTETLVEIKVELTNAGPQPKVCEMDCENPNNFVAVNGNYNQATDTWQLVKSIPAVNTHYEAQVLSTDSLVKSKNIIALSDMNDTSTCVYAGQPAALHFPLTIVTDAFNMKGPYKTFQAFTKKCEAEGLTDACVRIDDIMAYGGGNFGPCLALESLKE